MRLGTGTPIVLRMNGRICGSCTEPPLSHTQSQRPSRDPIAWSRKGLSKMTMLPVYTKTGSVSAVYLRDLSRSPSNVRQSLKSPLRSNMESFLISAR